MQAVERAKGLDAERAERRSREATRAPLCPEPATDRAGCAAHGRGMERAKGLEPSTFSLGS